MRTRQTKDTKQNDVVQQNLSTTKAVCKQMMTDSMKESSTRLTMKRVKEK